jgi:hypothetical protein
MVRKYRDRPWVKWEFRYFKEVWQSVKEDAQIGRPAVACNEENTAFLREMAMPWLRHLVSGLSPCMPKFHTLPAHDGFVVYEVELGQRFYVSCLIFSC